MHISCLFIFCTTQPGIGIGDSDGQLRWSFHSGFAVLGGDISNFCTVRFVAHQQYVQLLDIVDLEFPETIRQHVLCFLVAPETNAGHQDVALESSVYPIVNVSGFVPVALNFDLLVWCRMNFLVLFLTMLSFTRGLRVAVMMSRRWLPPLQAMHW